jgi:hypothetical protein
MSDLCGRLQDAGEAGTYRLGCGIEELLSVAEQAGFAVFDADLAQVRGKGGFLAAVAQAIHAPGWFGNNWDALADSLGDLSWRPAPGYVLLLRNGGETLGLGDAEHETAADIFTHTTAFWKYRGKPFWVFFSDAE